MAKSEFGHRLKEAFRNATNKEIANQIGVSAPAVQNYSDGRVPPAETLLKIAEVTNCDLHWLLTGEARVENTQPDPLINEAALEKIIRRIVREEIGTESGDEIGPFRKADIMLARSLGKVDGGEEEEKIRKTG